MHNCGLIGYAAALAMQETERHRVLRGESPGTIFFLEHDAPCITIGRFGTGKNLVLGEIRLKEKGTEVFRISRGGDVTAHEPGQLVIYFVVPVRPKKMADTINIMVRPLVRCVEELYGLILDFDGTRPGLWHAGKKVCSMGFDFTGGVSMHGLAINAENSLETFGLIRPCGMDASVMTTISRILDRPVTVGELIGKVMPYYEELKL